MLREPLTSTAIWWGAGGTLALSDADYVTSLGIPIQNATQLNFIVDVSIAGGVIGALIGIQWSADGVLFGPETVEALGAIVGDEQRYTLYTKAWGPITTSQVSFARPCAAHFLMIGVKTTAPPAGGDYVKVHLERQRGDQLGAVGS